MPIYPEMAVLDPRRVTLNAVARSENAERASAEAVSQHKHQMQRIEDRSSFSILDFIVAHVNNGHIIYFIPKIQVRK
jgi:hypothetical protein